MTRMPKRQTTQEGFQKFATRGEPDACWPWIGAITKGGYGLLSAEGTQHYSHRLSYQMNHGEIPSGLWVLHKCDNRKCCNPAHLFLGTHIDNMRDASQKKRLNGNKGRRCARLTKLQVSEIRRSAERVSALAAKFKVCDQTIRNARRRLTWRGVVDLLDEHNYPAEDQGREQ